jgi:penicillin-binding protein 2
LNFIRKAMWGVVDHGTAAGAKLPLDGIQMAGKTGTAQTHNLSASERGDYTAAQWKLRDHSLFMAFAPYDNPRYAAATIVEHGGFGAAVAAPLIRDTLLFLYDKRKAIAALQSFEQSIGGPLGQRIARKTASWRAANGLPPLPAKQA